ncbi:toxin-antitoxin system YwqK family antitoxin [Sphingobacterium psychroaquaticum]|uniref:MORN repeat variant n=1 Tax=Sphingobacterium psychroaquaticum TaxID=561061 RepID=A0A1X7KXA4_9SPHI|nr:hypothetical protein [Sphingobacterium psychroaquaticum]QBQ39672.1 hypothetical protein E2P86_00260 [Sphingobacterium psychroaquaticum]SMG46196.1 MORN repeat variant [Sphingobacterium psychroaquaticum]
MKSYIFYIFLFFALSATAQQEAKKEVFFENASNGLVRFHFDKHYYLVDKNCPFKSIERLSQFIVSKNVFHGEFKDFDPNGRLVLTGTYIEGIKEGNFKAYHPNGQLKWEMTFKDNFPIGDANYYYPDGKPMLTLNYSNGKYRIVSFWDSLGRQRVEQGNGNYEFKMPFDFYNEYGYPFYERRGKLKNGLPTGYWITNVMDEKNRRTLFTEETYDSNGRLTSAYNLFLDDDYTSPITWVPTEYFPIAESLTYKQCNFDDFSGFNAYLSAKLEEAFNSIPTPQAESDDFTYTIRLDKEGIPQMLKVEKELKDSKLNQYLEQVLKRIPFYFPSLDANGAPIEDKLTISGKMMLTTSGKLNFHSISIKREKQASAE